MQSLKEKQEQDDKYNPAEGRYGSHDDLGVHPERREAEIDDLENLHNAESRDSQDRNNIPKSKSALDEQSALDNKSSDSEPKSNWNTDTKKGDRKKFKLNGKRATAGGAAAGLLVGGGIGFSVFLAGPLQFLQFSQLLKQFHFSNSERFGDSRSSKLFRYATRKIRGKGPHNQDYNLSRLGNKIAVHYEKKLINNGIFPEYDGKTGRINSMHIDTSTPAGKELLVKIEKEYGVSANSLPRDKNNPKLARLDFAVDSAEITKPKIRRKILGFAVESTGIKGISGALSKRLIIRRGGVTFTPLSPLNSIAKSVDEKINLRIRETEVAKKIKNFREEYIKKGSVKSEIPGLKPKDDSKKPASDAEKNVAKEVGDEAANIGEEAGNSAKTLAGKVESIKNALAKPLFGAAVVSIICGLGEIGNQAAELQEANIVGPLMRSGGEVITTGYNIMAGKDVNMEVLGELSKNLYNKEDKTSWMSAESIQAELGKPNTGKKMSDAAKPGRAKPAFFSVLDTIISQPGVSQVCSTLNSTFGSLAMTALGFATAVSGFGTALVQGATTIIAPKLLEPLISNLIQWIAGPALSIAGAKGADYGNFANYGAFLTNNNTMAAMGGRTLTTKERLALVNENKDYIREENKQKSLYARLFDIKDVNSLTSKSIIQNPKINDTQMSVASLIGNPLNIFNNIGSSLAKLNPRVSAESSLYDYGVDEIGFSIEERESPDLDDPYSNAEQIEPRLDALNEKYGKVCFGTTIDPSSGKPSFSKSPSYGDLEKNKAICGSENKDSDFIRYRMYIADMVTMNTLTCYESIDEDSCNTLGVSSNKPDNQDTNNISTPTITNLDCPTNMTNTKTVGSTTYYKLPDAAGGEYTIYSKDSRRYGHKELVCVLNTVAKAYKTKYGAKSTLSIGDLNAAGHKSHKWGVAVDLDAQGDIVAADNQNNPSKYNTEATITLGKMFVDTGLVKNIWYCSHDNALETIKSYAQSVGKPINGKCIEGHWNHFHIDINVPHGDVDTPQ